MSGRPEPQSAELSARMARVKRRDTVPELALRSELHRLGLRFRLDVPPVPGVRSRADVVFRLSRVAVYVNGCFWHACPEHGNLPANNRAWWRAKLAATVARDRRTDAALTARGWLVVRVWEHEDPSQAARDIACHVRARRIRVDP